MLFVLALVTTTLAADLTVTPSPQLADSLAQGTFSPDFRIGTFVLSGWGDVGLVCNGGSGCSLREGDAVVAEITFDAGDGLMDLGNGQSRAQIRAVTWKGREGALRPGDGLVIPTSNVAALKALLQPARRGSRR
jgi:hypothetical protein